MLRARDTLRRTEKNVTPAAPAMPKAETLERPAIERASCASPTKIIVDPRFNAYRYGYYVLGLRTAFPEAELVLSVKPFLDDPADGLAFVLHAEHERRVFVCAEDSCTFDARMVRWCDVYAKVNLSTTTAPVPSKCRVVPLGPSFGVRVWPLRRAIWQAARTWWHWKPCGAAGKEHFANYWRQYRYRLSEQVYRPQPATEGYIFLASSLWRKEPETNELRRRFMEVARSMEETRFEGGFAPRTNNDVAGFEHLALPRRYPVHQYVRNIQASAVAFNTPAVRRCHGWKLGEFLALGKAIVSTPLTRLLPAPLVHGRHIHYVDGSRDSIAEAIDLICSKPDYRRSLERAARQYYDDYLAPHRVAERLLEATSA